MGVSLARNAPVDNSAAMMHVRYLHGDRLVNIQRIHLSTASPSGVVTAFNAYADVVKAYYDSAWTIQLSAMDIVTAGVSNRVPCPVATDRPGTGATATTGVAGITETIFVFSLGELDTQNSGRKGRLRFIGIGGSAPDVQVKVSSSAGGSATDQALVALVTNTANAYRSHDGLVLLSPADKSIGLAKAERRRSMRAA